MFVVWSWLVSFCFEIVAVAVGMLLNNVTFSPLPIFYHIRQEWLEEKSHWKRIFFILFILNTLYFKVFLLRNNLYRLIWLLILLAVVLLHWKKIFLIRLKILVQFIVEE
jgi:hypothetical protein